MLVSEKSLTYRFFRKQNFHTEVALIEVSHIMWNYKKKVVRRDIVMAVPPVLCGKQILYASTCNE